MAEEVKITVIATGFRQGSPERREQMLSAALRPEAVAPRIETRPPTPRFASEETEAPQPRLVPFAAYPGPGFLPRIRLRLPGSRFRSRHHRSR
jgi:hypothetical protein